MGFVRVSGYSESDLELASFNAICNCEYYNITGTRHGVANKVSSFNKMTFKFGKDYAWAIVSMSGISTFFDWSGTGDIYNLTYRGTYPSGNHTYEINTEIPCMILIKDIKKGEYITKSYAANMVAGFSIIACPLHASEIGTAPDPDCGFYLATDSDPVKYRSATNYPYGTNFTNNINGDNCVHWYYPSGDPTPVTPNIPKMTSVPVSSSGGNSSESGGSDENTPQDEQDPINPGDPFYI